MENYEIIRATFDFDCPICGTHVKTGDNCAETEGCLFCLCVLGAGNPSSASPHSPQKGGKIRRPAAWFKQYTTDKMRFDNIHMRLELETIAADPEGEAAKKIIAKYRRMMKAAEERHLSRQN